MGKQGRRKQRQTRRQQHEQKTAPTTSNDGLPPVAVNPSSAIHQLRHADPKVRQNALIALQANIIHQEDGGNTSTSRDSSKVISVAVLQAIREQVMDNNLECASAAAECLALYLSYCTTTTMEHQAVTTASWIPILMSRLDQCLTSIQGDSKKWKHWYAVAGPCMKTLCKLIESNQRALDYITSTTIQMDTFWKILLGFLTMIAQFEKTTDIRFNEWVEETAIYAARTLHSSLDENPDLVARIQSTTTTLSSSSSSPQNPTAEALGQLFTALPNLPHLSRVHLCGSLVNMYQLIPSTTWLSTLFIQYALPSLNQYLIISTDHLQSSEQAFSEGLALRKVQKEDEELEGEIIRKIQDRKEPARLIARRQKDMERGSKPTIEEIKDGEEAMEEAITAWSTIIIPLQLTLEVTANLLSTFIRDEDDMDQDIPQSSSSSSTLHTALITTRLAESLVTAMQTICTYQEQRLGSGGGSLLPKEHEALTEDLQDCMSKLSACITNAILSKVLESSNYEMTWHIVQPHVSKWVGMSSILVTLVQNGLPILPQTMGSGIQELLHSPHEESQRDGVSLLANMMMMMNNQSSSVTLITDATQELLRILSHDDDDNGGSHPSAKIEALNVIMDLWGEDDYYPDIFIQFQILSVFQRALATLSTLKKKEKKKNGNGWNPEEEEILWNASRFVDYKLGR